MVAKAKRAKTARPARAGGKWTLTVPNWTPPSKNEWVGRHWRAKARATRSAADLLVAYAAAAGVPRVRPGYAPRRRVTVLVYGWPKGRVPDSHNLLLNLFDGLKRAGLIVDDADQWVEYDAPVIVRSPTRETVVTLEDLP